MAGAFSFPNAKIGTGLFVHYSDGSSLAKNVTKWLDDGVVPRIICILISLYGIYAFIIRGVWKYMFGLQQFFFFEFNRGYVLFVLDYVSIIVLFGTMAYYLCRLIGGKK